MVMTASKPRLTELQSLCSEFFFAKLTPFWRRWFGACAFVHGRIFSEGSEFLSSGVEFPRETIEEGFVHS
jgi:hypothetical protein